MRRESKYVTKCVNLLSVSNSPGGPVIGHYVNRLPAPHVLWGRTDELRCATFWCDKGSKQRMSGHSFWMNVSEWSEPSRFIHTTAKLFGCSLPAQILLLQTPFWRNIQGDWCARVLPLFHLTLLCLLTLNCIYWVRLVSPKRFHISETWLDQFSRPDDDIEAEPFFVPLS